jgi:cytochrome c biogenesis protein CcdA
MLEKFIEITGYALADSVNPCEIAVLAMVLMTILIQNPEKRKKALFAGFAFSFAVYIGYTFYALILYQIFHSAAAFFAENSRSFKLIFSVLAMVIGTLNIKDFFFYKKGNFATEMPIWMRPKVKKIIDKITSPLGAFFIGFLVTLFLLPCTAGPLILATGRLSELTIWSAIPWLLYYNLIFILPMIAITLIVFFGFKEVDEIAGWKERNIRKLHLIAGILLFAVGVSILAGWL